MLGEAAKGVPRGREDKPVSYPLSSFATVRSLFAPRPRDPTARAVGNIVGCGQVTVTHRVDSSTSKFLFFSNMVSLSRNSHLLIFFYIPGAILEISFQNRVVPGSLWEKSMLNIINYKLKFCIQKSGLEYMFGSEGGRIRFSLSLSLSFSLSH